MSLSESGANNPMRNWGKCSLHRTRPYQGSTTDGVENHERIIA